jgi:hypothetical protein
MNQSKDDYRRDKVMLCREGLEINHKKGASILHRIGPAIAEEAGEDFNPVNKAYDFKSVIWWDIFSKTSERPRNRFVSHIPLTDCFS